MEVTSKSSIIIVKRMTQLTNLMIYIWPVTTTAQKNHTAVKGCFKFFIAVFEL
jgi:hypothetical protein